MKRALSWMSVSFVALVWACSSSSSGTTSPTGDGGSNNDAAGSDAGGDAASKCGDPGDTGNALGIGKYCTSFGDCTATSDAHICSILGDTATHFCTRTCTAPDDAGSGEAGADGGQASECGADATCTCDPRGCGCTPNKCL